MNREPRPTGKAKPYETSYENRCAPLKYNILFIKLALVVNNDLQRIAITPSRVVSLTCALDIHPTGQIRINLLIFVFPSKT
jgi:hypothetical protein